MTVPAPDAPFLDPEVVPADLHRRAGRALVVDGDRVLLEHACVYGRPEQGSWWELPGGGIEAGETSAQAAAREVAEETGYDVEVGPAIATARVRYHGATRVVEQHTVFHVARLRSHRRGPSRMDPHERAGLLDIAWLDLASVQDGRRLDFPELPRLVRDAIEGRLVPRRIRDRDVVQWSNAAPLGDLLPDGAAARVVDDRLVVRDAAPWTSTVHRFLDHLHDAGVDAVPRPLGVDAHGREAVTFLPGDASGESWPAALRTDDGMAAVGRLLRRIADAAATFTPPTDAVWRTGPSPLAPGQGVAHGDVGHGNLVWRADGSPALIDWEFAHPAAPLHDLAGAAAWLVPLVDFDHARRGFDREPDRRSRLHALAAGAGVAVTDLLDAVPAALRWERGRVGELGGLAIRPYDDYLASGQVEGFDRALAWLREQGTALR